MIQAIETPYNGYRFRSRIEARWAVFFDALGIRYEYEKEGYELPDIIEVNPDTGYKSIMRGGVRYLPDFYLPNQNYFIEIKGVEDTDEWHKISLFKRHLEIDPDTSTTSVFVFVSNEESCSLYDIETLGGAYKIYGEGGFDHFYYWTECPGCKKLGIGFSGWSERVCNCPDAYKTGYDAPRIVNAYEAARSARFEHGETPRVLRGKPH